MNDSDTKDNFLSPTFSFSIKNIVILVLFVIGLVVLLPKLVDASEALKYIFQINKFFLLIGILFEIGSYIGAAWLTGIILKRLGFSVKFFDRFRLGSIAAFAIHFFPVGSFGQGATDFYFLRKKDVDAGSILLMLILRIMATYAAFLIIFLSALAFVQTAPNLPFSPKIVSIILIILVFGGVFYMYWLYHNKDKFRKVWGKIVDVGDFFGSKIRGKKVSAYREAQIFDEIHDGIGRFLKRKRTVLLAVLAGLIYWLGDITCFYFVFLALGYKIHLSVLAFGYCVSFIVGLISFIPGGLGVTEGSMGLIYSGLGVSSSLAVVAILVFRFFSFWIWIPVGLYSYITLNKEIKEQK